MCDISIHRGCFFYRLEVLRVLIVEGDHGIPKPFTVSKGKIESIEGASVEVGINRDDGEEYVVQATILDATNAKCSFLLTSDILSKEGTYTYQWTCYFQDGRIWSGKPVSFFATDKVVEGVPGGATVPVIVPFVRMDEFEALKALVEQGGGGTGGPIDGGSFTEEPVLVVDGGVF
jgi:hypothetical protein